MTRRRRVRSLLVAGALLVALAAPIAAAELAGFRITRSLFAGGGGRSASPSRVLRTTIGQPLTGSASGPAYSLCSGVWCEAAAAAHRIYLPLVVR
jgi:hypothetical protein